MPRAGDGAEADLTGVGEPVVERVERAAVVEIGGVDRVSRSAQPIGEGVHATGQSLGMVEEEYLGHAIDAAHCADIRPPPTTLHRPTRTGLTIGSRPAGHTGAMSLGCRLLVVVCSLAVLVGLASPAGAADETTPTTLSVTAAPRHAGSTTTLQVDLVDQTGAPVADAQVQLERRTDGAWTPLDPVITDADGHAVSDLPVGRDPDDNAVRATYAGDQVHAPSQGTATLQIERRPSKVTVHGPRSVVDEQKVALQIRWRTGNGQPVAGKVRVLRALGGGKFKPYSSVRTDADGSGRAPQHAAP